MKLLLLAGEESGALYADALRRVLPPEIEVRGYADYGFKIADLAVMGFWAVLCKLRFFLRVRKTMCAAIREWRPDVVCTVDYPGMNLKLAVYAKKLGIRTVHVVCPQVWAWRQGRIPKIEAALDHLCCFFPFEPKLFRPGFAEFVGHPLVDAFSTSVTARKDGEKLLALLPGSRLGEIEALLPTMLEASRGLSVRIVIPAANDRAYHAIQKIVNRAALKGSIEVVHGGARELLKRATCAVVASGTATLEAALARCPTVLVYKVGKVTEFIARRLIKGVHFVGLANIVWEKSLPKGADLSHPPMPELLQADFRVDNIRKYLLPWLTDVSAYNQAVANLDAAMSLLKSDGASLLKIRSAIIRS